MKDHPALFSAPMVRALLAGLVSDIPRYEREKSMLSFSRLSAKKPPQSASVLALQSRILDVLKSAKLVLDALDRKMMDANSVSEAVGRKRSTVYKALYDMIDAGTVSRSKINQHCVEWRVA